MENLLKISNFILSGILVIVFAILHNKNPSTLYFNLLILFSLVFIFSIFLSNASTIISIARDFLGYKNRKAYNLPNEYLNQVEKPSNENWETLFEANPLATVIFDETGGIIRSNNEFEKMLKRENIKNSSNDIQDIVNINLVELESLSKFDNFKDEETSFRDNKDKKISTYTILFSLDEAEQKYYLTQIIDESEKTDLKEKFIQAQKMQAIGQLAGGVAHDFNNLLTAIIGFCDLLLTRHTPGDNDFVDIMQIKQNANRAANLVRQLLAFSRKQTMNMENLSPNEVLMEISNLIRRLIGENINLDLKYERNIWDIKADKSQIEQVLINLAVNSRDAMENGGELFIESKNVEILNKTDIKTKFKTSLVSGEAGVGKYVIISVIDTGSGIDKETLKKIFEPFFTTKGIGQGTGLGLATVVGIIEQTGGFISVSSQKDKGTEFQIFLKRDENSGKSPRVKEKIIEAQDKDLTGRGRVLIVEDEEPVRMFSSRALKNKGYEVLEAYSGENALDVIAKENGIFDLIISDVVMPGISGPELAEIVNEKYPKIKIIFVSGYGEDAFYERYGNERKFHFLPKPYTLNQLAMKAKNVLSQGKVKKSLNKSEEQN